MKNFDECFSIEFNNDYMEAKLHYYDEINPVDLDIQKFEEWLFDQGVTMGIDQTKMDAIANQFSELEFPLIIARGKSTQDGTDGRIEYELNLDNQLLDRTETYDFREVMKIPVVKGGDVLARMIPPTEGTNGYNVVGKQLIAKSGKSSQLKAGNNVTFNSENNTFYATADGQVQFVQDKLQVQVVYEINETVSMKTGNINFIGSIIIHGDVPSGYHIKAGGDVKIFGLVEAANITAGGSIFISEGFSGMKTGVLKAGNDIQVGYINQGFAQANHNIFVENSILHSECVAYNSLISKNGNMIGGTLSAGRLIEAQDIGNRLNTKTNILFGLGEEFEEKKQYELLRQKRLQEKLEHIEELGKRIQTTNYETNPKLRIALLQQKNKLNIVEHEIKEIEDWINNMESFNGLERFARLKVKQNLYPNTVISFGKYQQTIQRDYYKIQMRLEQNEIKTISL